MSLDSDRADPTDGDARVPIRRVRRVGLVAASVLAVLATVLLLALTITRGPSQPRAAQLAGPLMPPGMRAPAVSLVDQAGRPARAPAVSLVDEAGRPASLTQYAGRVVVISFMYSRCQTACPLMATEIRGALDDLPHRGRGVPVLAISVDPNHDTQASARRFVARERMFGRMRFLLGRSAQLEPIWKGYGVQPLTRHGEHSAFVFLMDRRGMLRVGYPASALVPEDLAHDLRLLLGSGRTAPK